jgi:nitrate/nitrite transport system ATP-binding protein
MKKPLLELSFLGMRYSTDRGEFVALKNVNLSVEKGEFISLMGHSGCGKSTLLDLIAGLQRPTDGGVILNNREVLDPGPDRALVFQNHALLPWLTVYQNVALALNQSINFNNVWNKANREEQVLHYLELVQMTHAKDKKPHEISGGMKQRVGIARALALRPEILLMDEPFGALDALTRAHLQDVLMSIHQELGNTVIMITHDINEAVLLSDRIIMMNNGPAANIGEILPIPLLRPRDRIVLANHTHYQKLHQKVLQFLHEKQRKIEILSINEKTNVA